MAPVTLGCTPTEELIRKGASKSNAKEQWTPKQLCSRHREQLVQIGAGDKEGSKRDASELKRKKEKQIISCLTELEVWDQLGSLGLR